HTARHDAATGTRLIGHDDNGIAGDVLVHVAREQPRIGVEAAAGRGADHDGHRPVLEQRLTVALRAGSVRCAGELNAGGNNAPEPKIVLAHDLPVAAVLAGSFAPLAERFTYLGLITVLAQSSSHLERLSSMSAGSISVISSPGGIEGIFGLVTAMSRLAKISWPSPSMNSLNSTAACGCGAHFATAGP